MRIQVLQIVSIDGVQTEPGIQEIPDGYAESLLNAGWAIHPTKRQSDEDEKPTPERPTTPRRSAKAT